MGREEGSCPMLTSPQHALVMCTMCISHAKMPELCLVPSASCLVCVHGACACKFVTNACVNLHGCSVCTLVYVCVMKCINEMCISCSGMCLC